MSVWQIEGNWLGRSPGVPRAVRAPWVTPPCESDRPGYALGAFRLGWGAGGGRKEAPALLDPSPLFPCTWKSAGFLLSTPPSFSSSLNSRPRFPLGLGLELFGAIPAGRSLLVFD